MGSKLARIVLIAAAFFLAACGTGAANSASVSCTGSFKATTDLGIGEGLKLLGNLSFQIDPSGSLGGTFTSGGQPDIQVVGQVSGRAVNLAADLGDGKYLFGSGTMQSSANGCPTIAGGPLAVETSSGSSGGPAKLLAPSNQVIIERMGIWFYQGK
jgi:hypothetical protein